MRPTWAAFYQYSPFSPHDLALNLILYPSNFFLFLRLRKIHFFKEPWHFLFLISKVPKSYNIDSIVQPKEKSHTKEKIISINDKGTDRLYQGTKPLTYLPFSRNMPFNLLHSSTVHLPFGKVKKKKKNYHLPSICY